MAEPAVVLRAGRERSLRRRHPWVFSGAVARVEGRPGAGDVVAVLSATGERLGWAAYSPESQIVARLWTFEPADRVDADFVTARVLASAARRAGLAERTDAARLVYSESDGLPGLIVDRFGAVAVVQLLAAGMEPWRDVIADALAGVPEVQSVYERSDAEVRSKEGLGTRTGRLRGDEPPELVEIDEDGRRYVVDVRHGHKTGFYLDQRDNRRLVEQLAPGRRVLDVFAYTGGFSVAAAVGGAATVTSVDSSAPSLALAAEALARNGGGAAGGPGGPSGVEQVAADAFSDLRQRRDRGERYDLVVLDPPKLAGSAAQVNRATRAYKDLNLQALRLLGPGGLLVTFSCSGAISDDLFQKVVFGAALDTGADVAIVGRLTQASDHPVRLSVPESAYLKGLVALVQ
jgi:23S rRNA (cytosine1962-C5)-methyltransferase